MGRRHSWPTVIAVRFMRSTALAGVITRADGTTQMSYNGHPLYHYVGDTARGDTTGHDLRDDWGHWSLLTPQGQPVGEPVGALESAP